LEIPGGEGMMDRLVIATETQNSLNAPVAQHFGRAPYFLIVDLDAKLGITSVKTIDNISEHRGGTGSPHDHISKLQPSALIVHGMGPRGIMAFKNAGIKVLQANANTVNEVIEAYKQGKLQELTEGCADAHHH